MLTSFVFLEKISQEKLRPVYEKRRSIVNRIPRFWALVIRGSDALSDYISYEDDEVSCTKLQSTRNVDHGFMSLLISTLNLLAFG